MADLQINIEGLDELVRKAAEVAAAESLRCAADAWESGQSEDGLPTADVASWLRSRADRYESDPC